MKTYIHTVMLGHSVVLASITDAVQGPFPCEPKWIQVHGAVLFVHMSNLGDEVDVECWYLDASS